MTQPVIALLTDFGTSDAYIGIMKGIIIAQCPTAQFVDISHEIAPQNIRQAAYLLHSAYRYFPAHTIFLVVIDPGVGTSRQAVVIRTGHGIYVGPDNGVFSAVLDEVESWQAVVLTYPVGISNTFHGRDVFAPTVAHIANGGAINRIGRPITNLIHISVLPMGHPIADTFIGEVIHIDHFGNLITSIGPFEWQLNNTLVLERDPHLTIYADTAKIEIGRRLIQGIKRTYGDITVGDLLALISSDRLLEIAVNQGSAGRDLNCRLGDTVRLQIKPEPMEHS